MEIKRKDLTIDCSYYLWNTIFSMAYRVNYSGHENIPKIGPALVVPKHQSLLDVPLEGIFLIDSERYANWIMKDDLPSLLDYWGAVRVVRPRDIRRLPKDKRKKELQRMKEVNGPAMEYCSYLFSVGEIIVAHLEGTRHKNKMGEMRTEFLTFIKKQNQDIPIIPIGIEYAPYRNIYVRAGKALDIKSHNLVSKLSEEISRLSNISI